MAFKYSEEEYEKDKKISYAPGRKNTESPHDFYPFPNFPPEKLHNLQKEKYDPNNSETDLTNVAKKTLKKKKNTRTT